MYTLVINALALISMRFLFDRTKGGILFWKIFAGALMAFYAVLYYTDVYVKTEMSIASSGFWYLEKNIIYSGVLLSALFLIVGLIWRLAVRKKEKAEDVKRYNLMYSFGGLLGYAGVVLLLAYANGDFETYEDSSYENVAESEEKPREKVTWSVLKDSTLGISLNYPSSVEFDTSDRVIEHYKINISDYSECTIYYLSAHYVNFKEKVKELSQSGFQIIEKGELDVDTMTFDYTKTFYPDISRTFRLYYSRTDPAVVFTYLSSSTSERDERIFDLLLEKIKFFPVDSVYIY